jgi:hypothetical protein
MLGRVPGFCAIGELRYLWEQGLRENGSCGCGAPFHDCEFWRKVGEAAFGGWDRIDTDEVVRLHRSIVRNRYLPLQMAPWLSRSFTARLARYTELMSHLYRGIQAASGCDVIVDSSKFPSSAYMLRHVAGIDMRIVHLVRSSQGCCYSWAKQVERADRGGRLMARHSPTQAALEWLGFNFCLDGLRLYRVPRTILRYEDFIVDPGHQMERVLAGCGQSRTAEQLDFIGDGFVELPADHSVAGNPMRIRTGRLPLRLDDEWRTAMPAGTRRLVTTLTAPGLLRYGYVRPRRRPSPSSEEPANGAATAPSAAEDVPPSPASRE